METRDLEQAGRDPGNTNKTALDNKKTPGDLTEHCDWSLLHSRALIYQHVLMGMYV